MPLNSAMPTAERLLRAASSRGLVDQIPQIGADEARRDGCDLLQIDGFVQPVVFDADLRGSLPAPDVIRPVSTNTWRSKRPGLSGCRLVQRLGRLVAAITITLAFESNPSISTSSRVQGLLTRSS